MGRETGALVDNPPAPPGTVKEQMNSTHILTVQPHPEPESQKTQSYSSKRRMNNLRAHTRSLPTELVAEIFQNCITPFQGYYPGEDTSTPLKLGAVCHTWRNTAWGCPHLWSSITLVISDREQTLHKVSLLQDWLSRSGKLPLSIRLHCSYSSDWPRAIRRTVYETLNLYAPRWCEIDFQVPFGSLEYLPSDTILPLLRYCSITPSLGEEEVSQIQLSHTPQLCHLTLDCGGLYLRSLFFEWHNLTEIEISGIFVDECMEILRRTPNFSVDWLIQGDDGYPETSHPIELNSLESIVVNSSSDHASLIPLFDHLFIPKGRKFKYIGMIKGDSLPVTEFAALLNRSACSLTDLSIVDTLITEADLFTIFPLTPSLQSLNLIFDRTNQDRPSFTENIWTSLNPSLSGSPHLLPRLEYLKYDGPLDFTWEVVLATIEARYSASPIGLNPNPRFKSLSFFIRGPAFTLDPDITLSFEVLKSAGLHLEIQDMESSSRQ